MIATVAALAVVGWLNAAGVVWGCYHAFGIPLPAHRAAVAWPYYTVVLAVVVMQAIQSVSFDRGAGL